MRTPTLLGLMVMFALTGSSPTCAAYLQNWYEGFESYSLGGLWEQGPWANSGGASTVDLSVQDARVMSGNRAVTQPTAVGQAKADLRFLTWGRPFINGYAKFWVYDPGRESGNEDGRVGIFSSAGADNVSKIFSAQVQYINPTDHWEAQWSWSPVMMDGVSAPSSTGYTFTAGPAAPRVHNAWSYVFIFWSFSYNQPMNPSSGGSGQIKWYINQTLRPNLRLNFDSTTGRWANSHDVAGVCIGSLYGNSAPCSYDNIEFHAIPEPSALLTLGAGMLGLLGMIRRKK